MNLSSTANITVCVLVAVSGFYWLRHFEKNRQGEYRFLFSAYLCWWLSWLVWVGAWTLIALKVPGSDPLTLVGSDLNAILLIILYFILTRGNEYKLTLAVIEFGFLCCLFAVGYGIFYIFLPREIAFNLQRGWSLCLGAVSTILLGWAFSLRYRTRAVLVVGFVYAFSQPALFEAVLNNQERTAEVASALEAVKFCVALLKIIWASVVTLYFLEMPETAENLVVTTSSGSVLPDKFPVPWLIQTALLIVVTAVFVIALAPLQLKNSVLPVLTALGSLVAFVTGLVKLVQWLSKHTETERHA